MTRIEKIVMVVLILAIIGTVVFWNDVKSVFTNKKETLIEERPKKDKKDKDDDEGDKKKKKDKDEANQTINITPGKSIA